MKPMMGKKKGDVLDVIMSAPMGDDEEAEGEAGDGKTAVMNFDHGDDEHAEGEQQPEEGTPEAKIADIRRGLDELEQMFR